MSKFTNRIPDATVRRFSLYLRLLEELGREGRTTTASRALAEHTGTTAAQVRKDLQHLGSMGQRGLGYAVPELVQELRRTLGLDRAWRVALVGAGRIGTALFEYKPFRQRGFVVTSVIDADPAKVNARLGDVRIRSARELENVVREDGTDLVIVAVPAAAAQEVADRVIAAGVKAMLNYAPVQLRVPGDVALRNVSMLVELESLSHALVRTRGASSAPSEVGDSAVQLPAAAPGSDEDPLPGGPRSTGALHPSPPVSGADRASQAATAGRRRSALPGLA